MPQTPCAVYKWGLGRGARIRECRDRCLGTGCAISHQAVQKS